MAEDGDKVSELREAIAVVKDSIALVEGALHDNPLVTRVLTIAASALPSKPTPAQDEHGTIRAERSDP
jgi:hypothetical protein